MPTPKKIIQKIPFGQMHCLGDSLTDGGRKYYERILDIVPCRWVLPKSPHGQFTDGYVWAKNERNQINYNLQQKSDHSSLNYDARIHLKDWMSRGKNLAEGGSTAYDYHSSWMNIIQYTKGFMYGFFLGNLKKQAHELMEKSGGILPNDIVTILIGANDFLTVGYRDSASVSRVLNSIEETIRQITTPHEIIKPDTTQQKNKKITTISKAKNIILFTLPDFSKTPRLQRKTNAERRELRSTDWEYNTGIKRLAKSYRYVDFSFISKIHLIHNGENLDHTVSSIKHTGIIVDTNGSSSTAYFVENKKLILDPENSQPIKLSLSKNQKVKLKKILKEKTVRSKKFIEWVESLAAQAKLAADVKVFDLASFYEEIYANPENADLTDGCAIYYSADEGTFDLPVKDNAIVLKKISDNKFAVSFFLQGQINNNNVVGKIVLNLTSDQMEKLTASAAAKGETLGSRSFELVGAEDRHEGWHDEIFQAVQNEYQRVYKYKPPLFNFYAYCLDPKNKGKLLNSNKVFFDDLHPSAVVHLLIKMFFYKFLCENYTLQLPFESSQDDIALQQRSYLDAKTLYVPRSHEAPAKLDGFSAMFVDSSRNTGVFSDARGRAYERRR